MNTITKTITKVFGMMMLLTVINVQAQWTTLKAHVQESDISKFTGQTHHNYKGLDAAAFEIIGSVETVKEKGQVKFMLRTQSINMTKYYTYFYRPALKIKRCTYGKLEEYERNGVYYPNEIGEAPFEAAMHTATATFDIEVSFFVKDKKYGNGYRASRIFKNVSANSVFWADEPLETNAPIEDIKLLNNPKPVSFKINDSGIQTAVLDFVAKQNQEAETRCKEIAKENEADKKKKDEETAKAEASAKEIAKMKKKLGGTINVTSNSAKTDDFWSGGADKSSVSKSKEDDFWSGGEEKTKVATTKPSNSKGIKGYEREEEWERLEVNQNGNKKTYGGYVAFKSKNSDELKIKPISGSRYYVSDFTGKYAVIQGRITRVPSPSCMNSRSEEDVYDYSIINRKGEVVMKCDAGNRLAVLGNTHFVIRSIGVFRIYEEDACEASIIDIRNGKEIMKLPVNQRYKGEYGISASFTVNQSFFVDWDSRLQYLGRGKFYSKIMPSFIDDIKQEMTTNNFVGCFAYLVDSNAYQSNYFGMNLIFLKDDGTYVEKKGVPYDTVYQKN